MGRGQNEARDQLEGCGNKQDLSGLGSGERDEGGNEKSIKEVSVKSQQAVRVRRRLGDYVVQTP